MTGSFLVGAAVAFTLPFAVCFLTARRGHARTAWWLPGGLLAMTLLFVAMGVALGGEMPTGPAAAASLAGLGIPAVIGGVIGILLGQRRP